MPKHNIATDSPLPPQRLPAEERRQQLIEVAIRLFSQKGFGGTRTKEIAAAANVNEAILFRHFASKHELYAAILDCKANAVKTSEMLSELQGYAAQRDDERLFRRLAECKLAHFRQDHEFLRLMLYAALEEHELLCLFLERHAKPTHDFLRGYIVARQAEGAFCACDPDATVRAFLAMLGHHALISELLELPGMEISDELAVTTFTQIFLNGLRQQ